MIVIVIIIVYGLVTSIYGIDCVFVVCLLLALVVYRMKRYCMAVVVLTQLRYFILSECSIWQFHQITMLLPRKFITMVLHTTGKCVRGIIKIAM